VRERKLASPAMVLVGLSLLSAAGQAIASDRYLIVPNPAGGTADALPCIVADALPGCGNSRLLSRTGLERPVTWGRGHSRALNRTPTRSLARIATSDRRERLRQWGGASADRTCLVGSQSASLRRSENPQVSRARPLPRPRTEYGS